MISLKLKLFMLNFLLVRTDGYAQQLYQQHCVFPVVLFYISLANYNTAYILCFPKHSSREDCTR